MAERYQISDTRPILGYEHQFPVDDYGRLRSQRNTLSEGEFVRRSNQLGQRTGHNLETALGERFNLQISKVKYYILDDQLISEEHDEPFLEIIARGQKYRQEHGSTDIGREKAEVEGFQKAQNILTDPQYKDAKIIIISPKGKTASMYQHNFFDIYEKQGDEIIMTRYASKSSYSQFLGSANYLDPFNSIGEKPTDADFLQNPLITYKSEEEIINNMNLDEKAMDEKTYQHLIETISALKLNYINALANGDLALAEKIFIATLNFSDEIVLKTNNVESRDQLLNRQPEAIIAAYSTFAPRQVMAGCGLQAVFAAANPDRFLSSIFPASVSEYSDTGDFPCPRCGHMITYGSDTKECPVCRLPATCG